VVCVCERVCAWSVSVCVFVSVCVRVCECGVCVYVCERECV
jgi:hypothetical protein